MRRSTQLKAMCTYLKLIRFGVIDATVLGLQMILLFCFRLISSLPINTIGVKLKIHRILSKSSCNELIINLALIVRIFTFLKLTSGMTLNNLLDV